MLDSQTLKMLNEFDNKNINSSIGVIAKLKSDFTYPRFGVDVTLKSGTIIHVDEDRMIGSYGEDHFTLEHEDYVLSYLN